MGAGYKDDIDRRLIALLQANARESTTSLAKHLDASKNLADLSLI